MWQSTQSGATRKNCWKATLVLPQRAERWKRGGQQEVVPSGHYLVEFGDYYYLVLVVPISRYFPKTDYHRSACATKYQGIPARLPGLVLRSVPQIFPDFIVSCQQQKELS
jgi:hypothetical protein